MCVYYYIPYLKQNVHLVEGTLVADYASLWLQVGVTVHTPGDPDKSVRIATAAALAESARKLAQEAASFIDEDQVRVSCIPCLLHLCTSHGTKSVPMIWFVNVVMSRCTTSLLVKGLVEENL